MIQNHKRTLLAGATVWIALLSLSLDAANAQGTAALSSNEVQEIQRRIDSAVEVSRAGQHARAARDLATLADSSLLRRADARTRHRVISLTGSFFGLAGDAANGIRYVRVASEMPQAISRDWAYRVSMLHKLKDGSGAIESLTRLADKWPDAIREVDEDIVSSVVSLSDADKGKPMQVIELLDALSYTTWPNEPLQAANYWKRLVLHHLRDDNLKRAVEVSARILAPRVLIEMRANKEYKPVVDAATKTFDVDRAIQRLSEYREDSVKSEPESLMRRGMLAHALFEAGRFEESLRAATSAIEVHRANPAYFKDAEDGLSWILEYRARAMLALDMPGAILRMKEAAVTPERGRPNVSQALNLGLMQCRRGDAAGIEAAIADVKVRLQVSRYGRMQVEHRQLCQAAIRNDRARIEKHLSYLREQRDDAGTTYYSALLYANDIDAAAAWLIQMLGSDKHRDRALFDMQKFPAREGSSSAFAKMRAERNSQVLRRADVRAAIAAVGNVQSYNLHPL